MVDSLSMGNPILKHMLNLSLKSSSLSIIDYHYKHIMLLLDLIIRVLCINQIIFLYIVDQSNDIPFQKKYAFLVFKIYKILIFSIIRTLCCTPSKNRQSFPKFDFSSSLHQHKTMFVSLKYKYI